MRRSAILAFAAGGALAMAGEAKKPKEKPVPDAPTEDELDKPTKAAVPPP